MQQYRPFTKSTRKTIKTVLISLLLAGCTMTRVASCDKPKFVEGEIRSGYRIANAEEIKKVERNLIDVVRFAETLPDQRAFIAGWGDRVYIQRYLNGYNGQDLLNVKSVSKVFLSLLFGQLLDEKKIETLDKPVVDYLPEYFAGISADDPKRKITLHHLLSMSSGMKKFLTFKEVPADAKDWVRYAFDQPMDFQPGDKFDYNCMSSHILVAVLEKIVKQDVHEYLKEKILKPLGITETRWDKDPSGRYLGGSDFYIKPIDLLAVVQLFFNKGKVDDKPLVSEEWLHKSTTPVHPSLDASFLNIGYGLHWWTSESKQGDRKAFFESGLGGQMLHLSYSFNNFMILVFDIPQGAENTFETQQSTVANFFHLLYY